MRAAPQDSEIIASELWGLGAVGIEELGSGGLRAAFVDAEAASWARDRFAPQAPIEVVDDDAWADAPHASLVAQRAGRFVVRPPWLDTPSGSPGQDPIEIVVDPGRAFGTGSHPSTRLALVLLGERDLDGARVVDLGCGSGVLSIAAATLGASVFAVDSDPAAVEATARNLHHNRALHDQASGSVRVRVGSIEDLADFLEPDLLVVNVTIDVHEALAPRLPFPVPTILATGILTGPQVSRCAAAWSADVTQHRSDGEWAGIVLVP